MAIDEIERTAMVQQLISTLGEEPAATLMKCVWPDGVGQLATKDDLAQFATKDDIAHLPTKDDVTRIVDERIAHLPTKDDVARIVDERIAASEERMKEHVISAVSQAVAKQTRWMAAMMTALAATVVSAFIVVGLS